jgi:autotransporter-associated beta strand protein
MSILINRFGCVVAVALVFSVAKRPSLAGSATWSTNPSSGNWNSAANWIPDTVPNSSSDIATFGTSNLTSISSQNTVINLDSGVFKSGAPSYTITFDVSALFLNGVGIVNNSGSVQSFVMPLEGRLDGSIFFYNSATAGKMTSYSTVGGFISFNDLSSAGSATFNLTDGSVQAHMDFFDSSTAADATVSAGAGANIGFLDSASGGNATLNLTTEATVDFVGDTNADHAIGNCIGGDQFFGAGIFFQESASAGEGIFTAIGGSTGGEKGGLIELDGSATADHATFVIGGGMGAGLAATTLTFFDTTTAAAANITANGGVGGSDGGAIIFTNKSKGGTASITLSGNSELDVSTHRAPGVTIGSLAGAGSVLLGANTLTIGSNNQSTTFSGVIQDTGGVSKSGTGTLTFSGASLYTGITTVSEGVLMANNKRGSATGTGSVQVQTGVLGGKGFITGPVTIGSGTGSGAVLAPSGALKQPATLTLKSTLTFKADSTYTYTLKAKRNKSQSDQVIAKGVTIESGAQFNFVGTAQGKLRQGTSFSVISNTASTPTSGTFANLPEGAILSVSGNNLQASYTGGDGNDLTLTVVP